MANAFASNATSLFLLGGAIEIEDGRNIDEPLRETVGAMNPLIWTALGLASRETAEAARCLGTKSSVFFLDFRPTVRASERRPTPTATRQRQQHHHHDNGKRRGETYSGSGQLDEHLDMWVVAGCNWDSRGDGGREADDGWLRVLYGMGQ